MVLQNPGGALVAMPAQAPQGIIYQQLADGRMIQLQAPSLLQPGWIFFFFITLKYKELCWHNPINIKGKCISTILGTTYCTKKLDAWDKDHLIQGLLAFIEINSQVVVKISTRISKIYLV